MTDLVKMTEHEGVAYGSNKVFFEERIKTDKNGKETVVVYTNIKSGNDRYAHYCQPTKERKIITPEKEVVFVDEKDLYKRAYDKFLAKKEALKPAPKRRSKATNQEVANQEIANIKE